MRAITSNRAGSADRLVLADVPRPDVEPDEVLIKVHVTTVTRGDVVMRKLPRLVTRLVGETPKSILGHEFAGEIEQAGSQVSNFEVGDRVFGTTTGLSQGSHAEYLSMSAGGVLATIPEGIGYEEAAPIPVGAMTALYFLDAGDVGAGSRVLINGASGSVGSFALQIARHMGAHVTGVSSAANLDLLRSLGADAVIDYRSRDFTEGPETYDVVFDAAGKTSEKKAKRVLSDHGRFVSTQTRRKETVEGLLAVRALLETGAITAVIDRRFSFEEVPAAHEHVESGQKRGNVIVRVLG